MATDPLGRARSNLGQLDPFALDLASAEVGGAGMPVKRARLPAATGFASYGPARSRRDLSCGGGVGRAAQAR
jgi:hypothetical protein